MHVSSIIYIYIYFGPIGPFLHIFVAIGFEVILCYFVGYWLVVEFL